MIDVPRVASSLNRLPRRELGSAVTIAAQRRGDLQTVQERLCRRWAWDARLNASCIRSHPVIQLIFLGFMVYPLTGVGMGIAKTTAAVDKTSDAEETFMLDTLL